ncbi:MAG: hypothetical protein H7Y31_12045 [Chitinophagaceae bacterium]|nr:hypothetical protein [Chitinophagaceae bacterium]
MTFSKILNYFLRLIIFLILTILTEIGGVIYIANFGTYSFIDARVTNKWYRRLSKAGSFALFYLLTTFLIVPKLAEPFGRVQLPIRSTNNLQPLTFLTCLLNRNYVNKELRDATFAIAKEMNNQYPGTVLNYLDANFPFINGFPLAPHLSHNDGKKIDLSFCYTDKSTLLETNEAPSLIGYGICEEPSETENNTSQLCEKQGYWQYSFLRNIMPQKRKKDFLFHPKKTKALIELFARDSRIGKIFIEPHLKSRLKLTSGKVRFHGCEAVRHDDHIHVQLY